MRFVFRTLSSVRSLSVNPNPKLLQLSPMAMKPSSLRSPPIRTYISPFHSVADILSQHKNPSSPITEKYAVEFRNRFIKSKAAKDNLQETSTKIDSILNSLTSLYLSEISQKLILKNSRVYIKELVDLYGDLTKNPKFYPGLMSERLQKTICILALLRWIETGDLLSHKEVGEKLGFDFRINDYLLGICLMTDNLPLYAAGKVARDDEETAKRALHFVKDVDAGFNIISNEFHGIKENINKLEEICFHVNKGIPFQGEMVQRMFSEGTTSEHVIPQGSRPVENNGEMFSAMYKMMGL